jgi:hypothetical protein
MVALPVNYCQKTTLLLKLNFTLKQSHMQLFTDFHTPAGTPACDRAIQPQ